MNDRTSRQAGTLLRVRTALGAVALCLVLALSCSGALSTAPLTPAAAATLPALPRGWPSTLQLGYANSPGGATAMQAIAPFGFRSQYLSGGVNTGGGWATWNPNGDFVTYYIQDSVQHGMIPVFEYYMLLQSSPGNSRSNEGDADYANLQNTATMTAYFQDLKLFFQRAGAFSGKTVVLQYEPDFWGFMQQRATGDDAATVPAQVSATGLPELAGLPNNVSGFAQAGLKLRDLYAPNVLVAYELSIWGTGNDIVYTNPTDAQVDALATRAANFFLSTRAGFDLSFTDPSDRDAAFKQYVYGDGGASWWDAGDYSRNVRFLTTFVGATGRRVAFWQIPLGNTKMRAVNNTWNHYQDNHVEWLLDDPGRTHVNAYVQAGLIGLIFGRGADGVTCNCDANHDGATNPAPINGNTGTSINADDDGGFFQQQARAYYASGALPLPAAGSSPTSTPTPTRASTATPSPTATPQPGSPTPTSTATSTPSPVPGPGFTTRAHVSPSSLRAPGSVKLSVSVTGAKAATALVDIEIYSPSGAKVFQKAFDRQTFSAGQTRTYSTTWSVPAGTPPGTYTVKLGIFKAGWGALYSWNDNAATVTVVP